MKAKVVEGSIVSIPFDDTYVVCKVLYVSNYFKNIALFKIYPKKLNYKEQYTSVLRSPSFELIYTGTKLVKNGKWPILGTEPITSLELELNTRIVGGDVWSADECVSRATDEELKNLPKMKVFNVALVEEQVSQYPMQNGT